MQFVLISLNDDDVVFICIEKEKRIAFNEYCISQLREGGGAIYKDRGKDNSYRFEENSISYILKKKPEKQ